MNLPYFLPLADLCWGRFPFFGSLPGGLHTKEILDPPRYYITTPKGLPARNKSPFRHLSNGRLATKDLVGKLEHQSLDRSYVIEIGPLLRLLEDRYIAELRRTFTFQDCGLENTPGEAPFCTPSPYYLKSLTYSGHSEGARSPHLRLYGVCCVEALKPAPGLIGA